MKKKKKIILVTRSAMLGGVEEHVSNLAVHLVSLNYSVVWLVLSLNNLNNDYRRLPGVRFVILNDTEAQSLSSFFLLWKLILIVWRFKQSVIHLHGIRPMLLLSLIPLPKNTRRVSTVHASYLLMALNEVGKIVVWKRLVSIIFHAFSCWRSDAVITVSNALSDELNKMIPAVKFATYSIYNGVDCSATPPSSALQKCIAKEIKNNEMQVVFVGRLEKNKGVETIIRAVSVLSPSVKIRCHLFGDGYQRAKFESLTEVNKVNNIIHFWGNLNGIGRLLYKFDVFILPSYSEGMPIAILEAMAAGLPVVATKVGGIPEAVVNEESGFLVDPGDYMAIAKKLDLLFKNVNKRRRLGVAGRQRVLQLFNSKDQHSKIVSIYRI